MYCRLPIWTKGPNHTLNSNYKTTLLKLVWVIPSILAAVLINTNLQSDLNLPVPFITLLITVVIAGIYGGVLSGFLAGLVAAILIFHSYATGSGPSEITGTLFHASFGSFVLIAIGAQLGRIKENSDSSLLLLAQEEDALRASLRQQTEERDAQALKVSESEQRLKRAVRIAEIGHFAWDAQTGNCTYCSEEYAAQFGMTCDEFKEVTKGREPYVGYVHEDDRADFIEAIGRVDEGEALYYEFRALQPNGDVKFIRQINEPVFDDTGRMVEVVGCSLDLTELREAEARIRQSQRIEAIGTLTGGVAHDFNNLLAIILGNLELSLEIEDPNERREILNQAIRATYRGADLTKNLLSFARRAHLTPRRLNLNQHIKNSVQWGVRILPENITIEHSLADTLWDTELDSTSLDNAIINILLNARDAMPDGGKITIKTANQIIDDTSDIERPEEIKFGQYVMLAISDTGHGLAEDMLDSIFEPFYTNKPFGMGSGLGLSMVQGFIKQSGGVVRVSSEVGKGTTFKLYFKATSAPEAVARDGANDTNQPTHTHSKILVAEDEEGVTRILRHILKGAGYHVTTAASGDEAFAIFQSTKDFDLLITDILMPGELQGPALAKAIRSINPDLPCVFLSGYATNEKAECEAIGPSDIRLMKPVSRSDILDAVSQALKIDA